MGKTFSSKGVFEGKTRKLDDNAFKIQGAKEAAQSSRDNQAKAEDRVDKAVQDRSSLISQLQGQSDGTAPSLAGAQLKSASERSLAQQLATAQSQRGGNASSRQRQLLRSQAQAGRDLAQQSGEARLAERNTAQQLLGQQVSAEQQQSDQLVQNYLNLGFTIEQARQQALEDKEKLETDQFLAAQNLTAASAEAGAARQSAAISGLANAAGGALSLIGSDEKIKTKIKKSKTKSIGKALNNKTKGAYSVSDEDTKMKKNPLSEKNLKKDFLDKLQAYTYEYKKEHKDSKYAGHGEYTSVMAQDLEKAGPIGESMVHDSEEGFKVVDYAKGYGAILAAQAHLNKRLSAIESKKSKRK